MAGCDLAFVEFHAYEPVRRSFSCIAVLKVLFDSALVSQCKWFYNYVPIFADHTGGGTKLTVEVPSTHTTHNWKSVRTGRQQ